MEPDPAPMVADSGPHCRVCGAGDLLRVLDLGSVPLANAFIAAAASAGEQVFPLGIQMCRACGLAQLTHLVDPDVLFRHYLYTPSASTTWLAHCRELSEWVRARTRADAPFVVEPASNDGALLREIDTWATRILGVEPARNVAAMAEASGIRTLPEFFSLATAGFIRAEHGPADVIVATNVLAHVPDMLDFLAGARTLLAEDGVIVVEAPYLRDLVESMAYDTIYHEHVSYLSVTALARAYELSGLTLSHVERTSVHGGSIRFVGRIEGRPDSTVEEFLTTEAELGYADGRAMADFGRRVDAVRTRLGDLVSGLIATGSRIAGYGATAKGNTLLTTAGLNRSGVRYIVDRNPLKQGLVTPGTHIPIVDESVLESDPVDILILLAWNLRDEILEQQRDFAARGGRFLLPIPEPILI